jgi:hypothetical protein
VPVRSGANLVLLFTLVGGVFFTLLSVAAWSGGRRLGSLLFAVVAGADFAFAIALFLRVSGS